jgi:hypothetical protein
MLYARTNFELKDPYSETLLKLPILEGLMPDPELESQTVPDLLTLEQNNEAPMAPMAPMPDMVQQGQNAKMQEISDSLSGFGSLGESESGPAHVASEAAVSSEAAAVAEGPESEPQAQILAENNTVLPAPNLTPPQAQPV